MVSYGHGMITPDKLASLRSNAGLKAADMARVLKVSPSHVSRVEMGKAQLSTEKLDEWVTACGYRLLAVKADAMMEVWADLDPVDAAFFMEVLEVWRVLPEDARERMRPVIRTMLSVWHVKQM